MDKKVLYKLSHGLFKCTREFNFRSLYPQTVVACYPIKKWIDNCRSNDLNLIIENHTNLTKDVNQEEHEKLKYVCVLYQMFFISLIITQSKFVRQFSFEDKKNQMSNLEQDISSRLLSIACRDTNWITKWTSDQNEQYTSLPLPSLIAVTLFTAC